jgi:hypothetical protein
VKADLQGFEPTTRSGLVLSVRQEVSVTLTMNLAGVKRGSDRHRSESRRRGRVSKLPPARQTAAGSPEGLRDVRCNVLGHRLAVTADMTWYTWLIVAAFVAALAAVTGIKPKGTRPVARTHLMGAARVALAFIILICLWFAIRG